MGKYEYSFTLAISNKISYKLKTAPESAAGLMQMKKKFFQIQCQMTLLRNVLLLL